MNKELENNLISKGYINKSDNSSYFTQIGRKIPSFQNHYDGNRETATKTFNQYLNNLKSINETNKWLNLLCYMAVTDENELDFKQFDETHNKEQSKYFNDFKMQINRHESSFVENTVLDKESNSIEETPVAIVDQKVSKTLLIKNIILKTRLNLTTVLVVVIGFFALHFTYQYIANYLLDDLLEPSILDAKEQFVSLSFDKNPSERTGIVSIKEGNCMDCGGQDDEIIINIPKPGDSTYVTVFLDFMADRRREISGIESAKAYFMTNKTAGTSPNFKFYAALTGIGADRIDDYSTVKGLPSSYKIEAIVGHIENEHGGINPNGFECNLQYDYKKKITPELFTSKGQELGNLSTEGGCRCAQGTTAVKYLITNTEKN